MRYYTKSELSRAIPQNSDVTQSSSILRVTTLYIRVKLKPKNFPGFMV